jgi:hypothetical protein
MASLRLHAELDPIEQQQRARLIAQQALRFCYTMIYRVAQYTRYVKADTTTTFRYDFSASPQRFIDLLRTGKLQADDEAFASTPEDESEVLERIHARDWMALNSPPARAGFADWQSLSRRLIYRPVDLISRVKAVGDR